MERLLNELEQGLRTLRENGSQTFGWQATLFVPMGRKEKIIQWFRVHTVVDEEFLSKGKILVSGTYLEIKESRGLVMVDTRADSGKVVRATTLNETQYMII